MAVSTTETQHTETIRKISELTALKKNNTATDAELHKLAC